MSDQDPPLTAAQKRAAHPEFLPTFSLPAIQDQLPFCYPVPEGIAPSPKRQYRSNYRYLGWQELADPQALAHFSLFEVALRLVDFSPLRDLLAQHYRPSNKGQIPFDPVSLFLLLCLRAELRLSWRKTAQLIAGQHGARWRRLFGFEAGDTPSESGLRYFRDAVGTDTFQECCALFIDLLRREELVAERSTYPGDPPDRGVAISHDIMLHEARSNMRCAYVTDSCYQPRPRDCPAQAQGQQGCDCSEARCAESCHLTTPLDSEARLIHYDGRNKYGDLPPRPSERGRNVYGYASNPDRLVDDRFACAWTLRTDLLPANVDERTIFPDSFAKLRQRFPDLRIGEVLGDAALGYTNCLQVIWDAGAIRMIDIRAAANDEDVETCRKRGYNGHGHPVCVFGYPMRLNGYDYQRRRGKWCCEKACLKALPDGSSPLRPQQECDYLGEEHIHGQVVNVGLTLPDGSMRLAREVPYGTAAWKRRYARRSLSESRNGSVESLGHKRLSSYGQTRGRKDIILDDVLINFQTLGRLVSQATRLALAPDTS